MPLSPSSQAPTPELVAAIADWFRAVADETRIRILWRLKQGECTVGGLVRELGVAQASVSKHLAVLRQARIVEARREGTSAHYRLRGGVPEEICALVCRDVVEERRRAAEAVAIGSNGAPGKDMA